MYNSYFLLRRLLPLLRQRLERFTLVSVFSQEKDELVMEFNDGTRSEFIRTVFSPELSIMLFPETFRRARKNAADLFTPALMGKVMEVSGYRNERSFLISMDNGFSLLFKLHGPSGNILMVKDDKVAEAFRKVLGQDEELVPSSLHREMDISREYFLTHYPDLTRSWFTFGKELWIWLRLKGYGQLEAEKAWELVQEAFREMMDGRFHIIRHEGRIWFSLLSFGEVVESGDDPFRMLERFRSVFLQERRCEALRGELLKDLQLRWRQADALVSRYASRLKEIEGDGHFQEWADLIMANLHRMNTGDSLLEAESFFSPGLIIRIKLDPQCSPQDNAGIYYRKSKNRIAEVGRLKTSLDQKTRECASLADRIERVRSAATAGELEQLSEGRRQRIAGSDEERLPYIEYEHMGYRILVGRSAQDNDELTLRHAAKNDLWLHARDCAGSHVVLRNRPGSNFPKPVIERAAALAAWHSKRKGETLCPVSYTERKFIRKRKGDPPGAVVMERETVIMAVPAP